MNVSIFKDLFKTSDVPYIYPIDKTLDRIKIGKSKVLIEKIRACKEKSERNKLKQQLPCILFAGEFSERSIKGLIKHSGLMIVDFDGYESKKNLINHFEKIKKNKHFYSLFISPSGNGIKGVVRIIPCTAKEHSEIFKSFQNDFSFDYWDNSNSDVSRVCYESYDPNIYINTDAEIYNPIISDKGFTVEEKVPILNITDESKIIDLIMNFNWGKGFVDGQKQNFIFDLAGAFCEYGINESTAETYLYNKIIAGSCKDEQSKLRSIKSAYKKRQFGTKYFEDYKKIDGIKKETQKGFSHVNKKYGVDKETFENIKEEIEHDQFWYYDEDKKGNISIKLDLLKYKYFLERSGFKKYYPNESIKPNLVRVVSNRVSITSVEVIKDFVLSYLLTGKNFDVWSYCANYSTMFSDSFLNMLDTIELKMLIDEQKKSFIAYQNGILQVTELGVELIDFVDIDFFIWDSHILKRNFKIAPTPNDYQTFINNISGGQPLAIECSLGYLISTYKNKLNNKAVILNDEVISENPEGGTGKGLLVQGLQQIRRVAVLDGKSFDDKKSFPYQTVNLESQILFFDDVKKNFDFESKFSLVTEGLTLERKNKDAIKLSVADSPKILISTNYAIKGEGNSHDRRRHELEFSQHYGKDKTPLDEFGKELFDQWNDDEFASFDNYIVHCLQVYFQHGLIKQNAKNINKRKFIAETSIEFLEWSVENIETNRRIEKKPLFQNFIDEYPDFKKFLTQKRFNIWIQKLANLKNVKYQDGNSNGVRWFELGNVDFDEDKAPF